MTKPKIDGQKKNLSIQETVRKATKFVQLNEMSVFYVLRKFP